MNATHIPVTMDTEYSILLDLFIRLVDSSAGQKITPDTRYLYDAQTLAEKLFRHLVSMQMLASGSMVTQEGVPSLRFIDHASVKVVARAALESYLVFFYIYGCADRSLSEFRWKTWQLGGLADRQKFHVSVNAHRDKLAAEKAVIDQLKADIQHSPYFREYRKDHRLRLLKGEWRFGKGWANLGQEAGFHPKYFSDVYSYLCGYSHSSYASALQVGQARSIDDQKMLTQAILGIGVVIMAHFAFAYSRLFDSASSMLEANPKAKEIAKTWQFGKNEMAHIYET